MNATIDPTEPPALTVAEALDRLVDGFGDDPVGPAERAVILRDAHGIPHRPSLGGVLARRDRLDLAAFRIADLTGLPHVALAYVLATPASHVAAMIERGASLDRALHGEPLEPTHPEQDPCSTP